VSATHNKKKVLHVKALDTKKHKARGGTGATHNKKKKAIVHWNFGVLDTKKYRAKGQVQHIVEKENALCAWRFGHKKT
jgi:hypothetical protein